MCKLHSFSHDIRQKSHQKGNTELAVRCVNSVETDHIRCPWYKNGGRGPGSLPNAHQLVGMI